MVHGVLQHGITIIGGLVETTDWFPLQYPDYGPKPTNFLGPQNKNKDKEPSPVSTIK